MDLIYIVADPLVEALSVQFEARTPRAVDGDGDPTETAAVHVQRAVTEWLDGETAAARQGVAAAAVKAAKNDTELGAALVDQHKLAHPAR